MGFNAETQRSQREAQRTHLGDPGSFSLDARPSLSISAHPFLIDAAMAVGKQYGYEPVAIGGTPVMVSYALRLSSKRKSLRLNRFLCTRLETPNSPSYCCTVIITPEADCTPPTVATTR
jgi:hypothetical protein